MSESMITRDVAIKVRDTVAAGLVKGVGKPIAGQMCVEAAVCYALGLPHGDDPGCVSEPLRRLKIGLNDRAWSSNMARAAGLRRLAIAQLGSQGALDDREFVRRIVDMTIRKAVPAGLRSAARVCKSHTAELEAAAVSCEREGTRNACKHAQEVANKARAYSYAAYAADAAAYAAAYADAAATAAADAAAYAAYAAYADAAATAAADAAAYAAYAAYDAAATAAADAAATAAADAAAARDKSLAAYAEWVVEILIDMKAPGCEFLDLVPLAGGAL